MTSRRACLPQANDLPFTRGPIAADPDRREARQGVSGVPGADGEDNERLTVEVGQRRRLLHRRVRRDELLDRAPEARAGRGVGTRLAPDVWRQTAVGALRDQPSATQVSHQGEHGGGATEDAVRLGPGRQGRARFRGGGVQQHQAGSLVGIVGGEGLDVQAAEE